MEDQKIAVVGIGATGAVLAAALLSRYPETILVDPKPGLGEIVKQNGIKISGAVTYQVRVRHFFDRMEMMKGLEPNLIFVSTKTYHLARVLEDLKSVFKDGTKIVSTHNGLGPEDVIADTFGPEAVFRMSLNFGVALKGPAEVEMGFFNRPNHLGGLTDKNRELGREMARWLTESGLDTEYVADIKLHVWKKMVIKCTMASLCAVTDRTLKQVIEFPPTREIAENCFKEALAVAKAQGYDLGEDYVQNVFKYLEKVGGHKDSMCYDLAHKLPTEIDFLGGKVVEYGRTLGLATPFYVALTNLVRAIEDGYLPGGRRTLTVKT
ncbi:MAG: 2-dehydropantoate 2-reductase [Thermodesulfobacteriota bacterium]